MQQPNFIFNKSHKLLGLLLIACTTLGFSYASEEPWKDKDSKDGSMHAHYRIVSDGYEHNGETRDLIEYQVTTILSADHVDWRKLDMMESLKTLEDADKMTLVKATGPNSKLIYLENEKSFPMDANDAVVNADYQEDSTTGLYSLTFSAQPEALEDKGLRRFTLYDTQYQLQQMDNNQVKLTVSAHSSLPFNVPGWMLKKGFPKASFEHMERFISVLSD